MNEEIKSKSEQSNRALKLDGELEMEAVGVAGLGVAESRGGVAERPATPSRAIACCAERAGLPVPVAGYAPRGRPC